MRRAGNLALGGALLCLLAALLATPALYVPGLAALLAAAVAPAWVALTAARADVALQARVTTVYEGERVRLTVTVRRGLVPFPGVELLPLPGAGSVIPPARRRCEIAISAVARRRGRRTVGPARLRVADPLGICVRELVSRECDLLVLPRVYAVNRRALGLLEEQGPARARSPRDSALEVDSLRPYSSGGPASRIHWPTVARTGALMERGLTAEADPGVLVALDARQPESEEALDQAVRAAASLCVHLAGRGGCMLLLPGERHASAIGPDLSCWPEVHARLALVRPDAAAPRGKQLGRQRTLLYVTASAVETPPVSGRCYRVSPRPLAGLGVAFTVAGCAGQVMNAVARVSSA